MEELYQISLLLTVAAFGGYIAKLLRQPLIVGYLFSGIALSLFGFSNHGDFEGLAKIGVTLLLFLVGLEMNLGDIKSLGRGVLLLSVGQLLLSFIGGFFIASLLGFGMGSAVLLSVALSFSSTILAVKLISEKSDLASLYGKVTIGLLLVQDVVATFALVVLTGTGSGNFNATVLILTLVKIIGLFLGVLLLSKKILPNLFGKAFSGSSELLFIGSIAWAMGVGALTTKFFGLSYEVGGLLAGISLSNISSHLQVAGRTKPLRDFFLTIFFLSLGMSMNPSSLGGVIVPALILSAFVLISKPLIVMSLLGLLGFKKRTSFMSGVSVAQSSEFSLIFMLIALSLGVVNQKEISVVIFVTTITMVVSSYMASTSDRLYWRVRKYLTIFEKKNTKEAIFDTTNELSGHVIVVGCDRSGSVLVRFLKSKKFPFLVIDFNPNVFTMLTAQNVPILFGDITDPEILALAGIDRATMVISTVTNLPDNLLLLEYVKTFSKRPAIVITATNTEDAVKLYEKGATYVVVPQSLAGEYVRNMLKTYGLGEERIQRLGKHHFTRLLKH